MTLFDAIILGLVEGLTEYLPVSSTGHLVLAAWLLGLDDLSENRQAVNAFLIVIQGGAIAAVAGLYFNRVVAMWRGLLGHDEAGRRLLLTIVVAFVPAAVLGPVVGPLIERWLFGPVPVLAALAFGGLLMVTVRTRGRGTWSIEQLTFPSALIIGLVQCLAMWPGMSRSMVTIMAGVLVGLRIRSAAEFSFLLGLPTLGGACAYRLVRSFLDKEPSLVEAFGWMPLIVGFVVATIAAAIAVKWMVAWLGRHGLAVFGWYRLALCLVLGLLVWRGVVTISA